MPSSTLVALIVLYQILLKMSPCDPVYSAETITSLRRYAHEALKRIGDGRSSVANMGTDTSLSPIELRVINAWATAEHGILVDDKLTDEQLLDLVGLSTVQTKLAGQTCLAIAKRCGIDATKYSGENILICRIFLYLSKDP
jgi:hypothetical protein